MSEEKLSKLLEDIDSALYDLKKCQCNVDVTTKGHKWETYYGLDDDLIKYIRKIESSNKNLQSKIDKANEILDKHFQDDEGIVYKITGEHVAERNGKFIEELRDILKENK